MSRFFSSERWLQPLRHSLVSVALLKRHIMPSESTDSTTFVSSSWVICQPPFLVSSSSSLPRHAPAPIFFAWSFEENFRFKLQLTFETSWWTSFDTLFSTLLSFRAALLLSFWLPVSLFLWSFAFFSSCRLATSWSLIAWTNLYMYMKLWVKYVKFFQTILLSMSSVTVLRMSVCNPELNLDEMCWAHAKSEVWKQHYNNIHAAITRFTASAFLSPFKISSFLKHGPIYESLYRSHNGFSSPIFVQLTRRRA